MTSSLKKQLQVRPKSAEEIENDKKNSKIRKFYHWVKAGVNKLRKKGDRNEVHANEPINHENLQVDLSHHPQTVQVMPRQDVEISGHPRPIQAIDEDGPIAVLPDLQSSPTGSRGSSDVGSLHSSVSSANSGPPPQAPIAKGWNWTFIGTLFLLLLRIAMFSYVGVSFFPSSQSLH